MFLSFTALSVVDCTQVPLIQELLALAFPHWSRQIPVRGKDNSWNYTGCGDTAGKQRHMASAVEELVHGRDDLQITRRSTVLVDDDPANVRIALHNGVKSVWFMPETPESFPHQLNELATLVAGPDESRPTFV